MSKIYFHIVGLIKFINLDHSRSFSATSEPVFTGVEAVDGCRGSKMAGRARRRVWVCSKTPKRLTVVGKV